jgi:hypothetical protein
MKTGIVVLTTANGEKSKIASEVIALDEAVAKARAFQAGTEKADGFDVVEVWGGAVRRFNLPKPAAAEKPAAPAK